MQREKLALFITSHPFNHPGLVRAPQTVLLQELQNRRAVRVERMPLEQAREKEALLKRAQQIIQSARAMRGKKRTEAENAVAFVMMQYLRIRGRPETYLLTGKEEEVRIGQVHETRPKTLVLDRDAARKLLRKQRD